MQKDQKPIALQALEGKLPSQNLFAMAYIYYQLYAAVEFYFTKKFPISIKIFWFENN